MTLDLTCSIKLISFKVRSESVKSSIPKIVYSQDDISDRRLAMAAGRRAGGGGGRRWQRLGA